MRDGNETGYRYDKLGNRLDVNENGSVTYYWNNELNQYTQVGTENYSYDDNGNLIDDGVYKYYYDCEDRLTDVNDGSDDPVASYKYDWAGRRVRKITYYNDEPNEITEYLYDGWQCIAEYNGTTSALLRRFFYGPGIDEPICRIHVYGETEAKFYYHFDGLGSVVALSDENADVAEKYSYDVYGKPTIRGPGDEPRTTSLYYNRYMFTGREYDTSTGLYYYRARFYNPAIGRFMQTDPIRHSDGLNLYAYVKQNPINHKDPFGLLGYSPWPGHPPLHFEPDCYTVAGEERDREAHNTDDYMRHCLTSCRIAKKKDRFCAWLAGWWNEIRPGRSGRAGMREDVHNNAIGRGCAGASDPCGDRKFNSCEECCAKHRGS